MTAPSNSAPRPLLIVVGLNAFQIMFSLQVKQKLTTLSITHKYNIKTKEALLVYQILVAMKSEIPEPRPYPFWRSSSKHITMIPAKQS